MVEEITSGCKFIRDIPGKVLRIETAATADDGDTIVITLADYGMKTIEGIAGYTHTATDSIVISEAPTTSVTAGVLTITVGGSTDDKKRVFILFGDSN
jgi:hypothetical protein